MQYASSESTKTQPRPCRNDLPATNEYCSHILHTSRQPCGPNCCFLCPASAAAHCLPNSNKRQFRTKKDERRRRNLPEYAGGRPKNLARQNATKSARTRPRALVQLDVERPAIPNVGGGACPAAHAGAERSVVRRMSVGPCQPAWGIRSVSSAASARKAKAQLPWFEPGSLLSLSTTVLAPARSFTGTLCTRKAYWLPRSKISSFSRSSSASSQARCKVASVAAGACRTQRASAAPASVLPTSRPTIERARSNATDAGR